MKVANEVDSARDKECEATKLENTHWEEQLKESMRFKNVSFDQLTED